MEGSLAMSWPGGAPLLGRRSVRVCLDQDEGGVIRQADQVLKSTGNTQGAVNYMLSVRLRTS